MRTSSLFEQAQDFLQQYYSECNLSGLEKRLDQVQVEILRTGSYRLTEKELTYGAKLAWRNSNRCMGRLFWKTLKVRDRRTLSSAEEVFTDALTHLKSATQGGKIRSTLSVYATPDEGDLGFRILNKVKLTEVLATKITVYIPIEIMKILTLNWKSIEIHNGKNGNDYLSKQLISSIFHFPFSFFINIGL